MTGSASFLQSLGWAVFSSLWQLALLWILFQGLTAAFKNAKASFRSSLATFLLVTGFGWFIYTFFYFYRGNTPGAPLFTSFVGEEQASWLQQVLGYSSIVYLSILILPLLRFIRNYRYVQVIRSYGLQKIDVKWRIFVQRVAEQMDIRKKVQVWTSEFVSSPITIGFLKPIVLVPLAAMNNLTPQQLEAVLLHELSHIKRYDYLVNLVINFIKAILYFNPFVKSFVKIIEREREKSCDEMVLQFQYDSYEYASALLTLEKTHRANKVLILSASGKEHDLLSRVELIMGMRRKTTFTFNKFVGLLAGLIFIISLNSLLSFDRTVSGTRVNSLVSLISPFHHIPARPEPVKTNVQSLAKNERKESKISNLIDRSIAGIDPSAYINVNYEPVEAPALKKYQEAQVKQAIEKSKKVFENAEWKALERNVADVLTEREKEQLRSTYRREIDRMDWTRWEDRLKLAYDKVDWNNVNEQLAKAVNNIRIDSLQKVYNEAICKIDKINQDITAAHVSGIPDSGLTLQALDEAKQQMKKSLNNLKATKAKKIIHL